MTIQDYLQKNKLITDGSFGTYYAGKYQTDEIPEAANTEHPAVLCRWTPGHS